MKLSNKAYDILKWVDLVLLPSLATLYFALGSIWGFPYIEQIVGTFSAIETFIGSLIGISHLTIKKETRNERKDNV